MISPRILLLVSLLAACNFEPAATTGGAELPARGECPRGLALVSSDYVSTEVALLTPDGEVASSAFVSSASSMASGLAAPLSGDVEVAFGRSRANELVLIDREGTNVLSYIDVETAAVRAQLPVGTGFESNPQDYLELEPHLAVVPRLGENTLPGREQFDSGSDLLLVDPSVPAIIGSIPMPRVDGYLPNPVAVRAVDDELLVTLHHARSDFNALADGEIALFSRADLGLSYRLTLAGLSNCGAVEASPSGAYWAVACSGLLDRKGASPAPETSGLVLLDPSTKPVSERRRFAALELVSGPIQASVEFVNERLLLFKTQTALGTDADNQLLVLDVETGKTQLLASAERRDGALGYGIALGSMSCRLGCGDPCFVTDASRGALLRFELEGETLREAAPVRIDGAGLPPQELTPFW